MYRPVSVRWYLGGVWLCSSAKNRRPPAALVRALALQPAFLLVQYQKAGEYSE